MFGEQRTHVRVWPDPGRPVQIQIIGANSLDVFVPIDVSESGVGLRVPRGFDGCSMSGVLDVIIKLPGVRAFQVKGLIRHVRQENSGANLFGAEFVNLRPECRALLRAYVDERLACRARVG
jgi:hypothetical protein